MPDYSRKWLAFIAVAAGTLLATIDSSIVNIAVPTLVREFNTSLSSVEWVVLSYLLTITAFLLLVGRLGDMFGKKRIYQAGFVIFTLGSALCSLANSVQLLIVARVFQALGGAMIHALGQALLVTAFPSNERGKVLGVASTVGAVGLVMGPVLGGILLFNVGWRSIFWINIPIGIIGILLGIRGLADDHTRSTHRFDYLGAALFSLSLLGLLFGLTEAEAWGWSDPRIIACVVGGIVCGGLFVWWELRAPEPMLKLGIFRSRAFTYSLLTLALVTCGIGFLQLIFPIYLQVIHGMDQQSSGFVMVGQALTLAALAPICGQLSDKYGFGLFTIGGLVVMITGMIGFGLAQPATSLVLIVIWLMILGVSYGMFFSPNTSMVIGSVPREMLGVGGSLLAVMRNMGQSVGLALSGAVWSGRVTALMGYSVQPLTDAPINVLNLARTQTMFVAAGLVAVAIIPCILGSVAASKVLVQNPIDAEAMREAVVLD